MKCVLLDPGAEAPIFGAQEQLPVSQTHPTERMGGLCLSLYLAGTALSFSVHGHKSIDLHMVHMHSLETRNVRSESRCGGKEGKSSTRVSKHGHRRRSWNTCSF